MRGCGVAVGSATTCRSWAEFLRSILGRDRDTLARSVQPDRTLPDAAQPDLPMPQPPTPYRLLEAPRRIGGLGRGLKLTTSSVSGLVDRLMVARLVEQKPGSTDRRLVVCLITDQGRRELGGFLQLGRVRLDRVLARVSAAQLRVVRRALDLLVAGVRGGRGGAAGHLTGPW
jgi:DNA-binding MarR family transcriptional regulator